MSSHDEAEVAASMQFFVIAMVLGLVVLGGIAACVM
jgi:hypothetical protein